jgi:hypothetical protein
LFLATLGVLSRWPRGVSRTAMPQVPPSLQPLDEEKWIIVFYLSLFETIAVSHQFFPFREAMAVARLCVACALGGGPALSHPMQVDDFSHATPELLGRYFDWRRVRGAPITVINSVDSPC